MSETPAIYQPRSEVQVFTPEQKAIIKDQIAKGVSDGELQLFIAVCQRTGLDPFGPEPEIYAIVRKSKQQDGSWKAQMVLQASITGLRKAAQNTGLYGGQLGPYWCGADGKWHDVWLTLDKPAAAKVGIIRLDWKEPMWAVVKYTSYVQKGQDGNPTRFWAQMPEQMLALAAERQAIRKAFPHETKGLGSDTDSVQEIEPAPIRLSAASAKALELATGLGVPEDMIVAEDTSIVAPEPEPEYIDERPLPPIDAAPEPEPAQVEIPINPRTKVPFTKNELIVLLGQWERKAHAGAIALQPFTDNPTEAELVERIRLVRSLVEGAGQ
jgi:phage recombination protein Bet